MKATTLVLLFSCLFSCIKAQSVQDKTQQVLNLLGKPSSLFVMPGDKHYKKAIIVGINTSKDSLDNHIEDLRPDTLAHTIFSYALKDSAQEYGHITVMYNIPVGTVFDAPISVRPLVFEYRIADNKLETVRIHKSVAKPLKQE